MARVPADDLLAESRGLREQLEYSEALAVARAAVTAHQATGDSGPQLAESHLLCGRLEEDLGDLDAAEAAYLAAAAAREVVMPAGTVVIREGDEADALWILASGELSVQVSGDGTGPRDLPPVTAPGYVGELGLLHRIPRTATVRTAQPSTLLRIDGEDFRSALQASLPSPSLLAVAGARMARTPDGPPRSQTSPADHAPAS